MTPAWLWGVRWARASQQQARGLWPRESGFGSSWAQQSRTRLRETVPSPLLPEGFLVPGEESRGLI